MVLVLGRCRFTTAVAETTPSRSGIIAFVSVRVDAGNGCMLLSSPGSGTATGFALSAWSAKKNWDTPERHEGSLDEKL
jgi:hypothetical protein